MFTRVPSRVLTPADRHKPRFQDPFQLDKMAGVELPPNTPFSFDFPDARVDDDLSVRMRIPQKITIPGDEEESPSTVKTNPGDGLGSMAIPDRIEIGAFSPKNSDIPKDLRDEVVSVNSLSSMITPPRTLTVDDTKSAHYPQTRTGSSSASAAAGRANRDGRANITRDIDDER